MSLSLYTNNLSKSFKTWILYARYLLATDFMDKIRYKMMLKMNAKRRMGVKCREKLVSYVDMYYQDISKKL